MKYYGFPNLYLEDSDFSKIASQVGHYDNPWLIFSKYIDAVNENCVKVMTPKWENRILAERSSSCQPTALLWLNPVIDPTVQALFQNSMSVYKCLYTNEPKYSYFLFVNECTWFRYCSIIVYYAA